MTRAELLAAAQLLAAQPGAQGRRIARLLEECDALTRLVLEVPRKLAVAWPDLTVEDLAVIDALIREALADLPGNGPGGAPDDEEG